MARISASRVGTQAEEDWLVPYLSSTKYGKDQKINSQHLPPPKKGSHLGSSRKSGSGSPSTTVLQMLTETKAATGKHANARADDLRRRSWAAPAGALEIHVGASPNNRTPGRENADPALAEQRKCNVEEGETNWLGLGYADKGHKHGESEVGGRGGMKEGGHLLPSTIVNETEEEMESHLKVVNKTSSRGRRSMSGNGRRASLDYTDLEAVKERVLQASNLWALTDGEKGDDGDEETESQASERMSEEDLKSAVLKAEDRKSPVSQQDVLPKKSRRKVFLIRKWFAFGK